MQGTIYSYKIYLLDAQNRRLFFFLVNLLVFINPLVQIGSEKSLNSKITIQSTKNSQQITITFGANSIKFMDLYNLNNKV